MLTGKFYEETRLMMLLQNGTIYVQMKIQEYLLKYDSVFNKRVGVIRKCSHITNIHSHVTILKTN